MIETTVSQRRELVSERQIRETQEERQFREVMSGPSIPSQVPFLLLRLFFLKQKAAEKEALANQIATTLRSFYCSLCDKQYQTVAQYDEHTNSYAHHHKQRFKDMQTHAKGLGSNKLDRDSRLEKERKREEKEIRRMAKARGVKVSAANVSLHQKVDPPLSLSSTPTDPSKGFKASGWTIVSEQNTAHPNQRWSAIGSSVSSNPIALPSSPSPPQQPPPPLPSLPPPPTPGY